MIATTSELITLRIQHHETDLPLEAEEDSLTNGRASSLGVSDGTWVMVVTQCPHPFFDLPDI